MEIIIQSLILVFMFILGMQVSINDLLLLKNNIQYKKRLTNYIASLLGT